MPRAIVLEEGDNVATLVDTGSAAETCLLEGARTGAVELGEAIPYGHKVAIGDIDLGDEVIKYGYVIGRAQSSMRCGEHVHVHNLESLRGRQRVG